MLREFANWILDFANMAREIREHRDTIRDLQTRGRDLEEVMKLSIQEPRSARELEKVAREKLLLQLEHRRDMKTLPQARRRKRDE